MTIQELKGAIASANFLTISNCLKKKGFRMAYPDFIWKHKDIFYTEKNIIQQVDCENAEGGCHCLARVYQEVEKYGDMTCIEVILSPRNGAKQKNCWFVNMPIDEECERELAAEVECSRCKKIHLKSYLIEHNSQWMCPKCLCESLLEGGRNHH